MEEFTVVKPGSEDGTSHSSSHPVSTDTLDKDISNILSLSRIGPIMSVLSQIDVSSIPGDTMTTMLDWLTREVSDCLGDSGLTVNCRVLIVSGGYPALLLVTPSDAEVVKVVITSIGAYYISNDASEASGDFLLRSLIFSGASEYSFMVTSQGAATPVVESTESPEGEEVKSEE